MAAWFWRLKDGVLRRWLYLEALTIDDWTGRYGGLSETILVERQSEGAVFWDIAQVPQPLFTVDEGHIDSHLAHEDVTYYGRSRGMVRIHRWSPDEGYIPLLTAGPEADYVALRTAEPLTALMSTPSGPRLYLIEEGSAHLIGQAERAIHGPVRHDDALYFLADGLLMRWMNGESTSMGPVDWTCLFEIEGHPHVWYSETYIE